MPGTVAVYVLPVIKMDCESPDVDSEPAWVSSGVRLHLSVSALCARLLCENRLKLDASPTITI